MSFLQQLLEDRPFKKGDVIKIKKQFQDDGDDKFTWTAVDDEEKGRVTIQADVPNMRIKPQHVVKVEWIEHA